METPEPPKHLAGADREKWLVMRDLLAQAEARVNELTRFVKKHGRTMPSRQGGVATRPESRALDAAIKERASLYESIWKLEGKQSVKQKREAERDRVAQDYYELHAALKAAARDRDTAGLDEVEARLRSRLPGGA